MFLKEKSCVLLFFLFRQNIIIKTNYGVIIYISSTFVENIKLCCGLVQLRMFVVQKSIVAKSHSYHTKWRSPIRFSYHIAYSFVFFICAAQPWIVIVFASGALRSGRTRFINWSIKKISPCIIACQPSGCPILSILIHRARRYCTSDSVCFGPHVLSKMTRHFVSAIIFRANGESFLKIFEPAKHVVFNLPKTNGTRGKLINHVHPTIVSASRLLVKPFLSHLNNLIGIFQCLSCIHFHVKILPSSRELSCSS